MGNNRISLKPCPWCHRVPKVIKEALWQGSHGYHGCYQYYVECKNKNCRVQPKTRTYDTVGSYSSTECINKAISDWNNRK